MSAKVLPFPLRHRLPLTAACASLTNDSYLPRGLGMFGGGYAFSSLRTVMPAGVSRSDSALGRKPAAPERLSLDEHFKELHGWFDEIAIRHALDQLTGRCGPVPTLHRKEST